VRRVDFEAAYAETPPWDIGRPQHVFQRLADSGALRGRVLDAGCGTGEHALMAASLGLDAIGVDVSRKAIGLARRKAEDRGLAARFVVWDALDLPALGQRFDCVLDSGLFHVLDDADRSRYVESLRSAMISGGRYFMLCFNERVPGDLGPRRVSEGEIRRNFAEGWEVRSMELATMDVTFAPSGIPAWFSTIVRINPAGALDERRL
jgi:SAM-dependent methyltransferase